MFTMLEYAGYQPNLETDLLITKDGIPIENRGKGKQCFIKTNFSLHKYEEKGSLNALLLEEPENHLSHTNMKRLVERLADTTSAQLFITTHSSHICARLDLQIAAIQDNGGDHQQNCVTNYEGYLYASAKIFADTNPDRSTFEIGLYCDN
ncbi:hypothetical protein Pcaca05_28480 [Pectobacterium carotovorum subsp. carotovorum]|nr:hypothetical protein Pcaca05_28480 [Pectobacterium carotovorum subsp. carotovorum]